MELQVLALLDGYDLNSYIDGSGIIPSPTNTVDGVTTPNPAYAIWKRQDRLIYSSLLGAITVTIQPILSTTTTSYQIWETLSTTYAKLSRAHVKQIRQQLKTWMKGTMTIDAYVQGFLTHFDQLALLGKPIEIEDQLEYVLDGLPDEYKQVVDQIEGRDTAPSIAEVHEKLLNFEVKLQSKTTTPATTPITENVANYRGSNQSNNTRNSSYQGRGSNNNRNQQQTWQQQQFSTPGGQPPRGYQGRCQFCNVQGHSAKHCPQLQNVPAVSQSSRPFTPNASSWNPRANVAITQPYNPNSWILDSGATHHLTTDLANLSLHQPYTGGEEVTISDGSNLPISHTGSTSLNTPTHSFRLNDILYVPNLHKNLIYVYRLCNTNNVSVEFFPDHFQ